MKTFAALGLLVALATSTAIAGGKQVTVKVKGMVCSFCSQGITKKFQEQGAVEHVHVSMENKEVHLALKDGKDLNDETITQLIKDSGVAVEKIIR